ncbi:MAG: acyl-CoA dehydrogenase family protein [Planctomycetes bacterium]|nr:acyl-CoA dehydrogenase family protein [Planctomycetota bacterium]
MHNFELSEEQAMVQETVRKFVDDVAAPQALEHDEHGRYVEEGFAALAETGMLGAAIAEDAGGAGLGMVSLVVATEELARGCTSTARLFLDAAGLAGKALEGLPAAAELLGGVLTGEVRIGFVGPEHGIVARAAGDGVALDGAAPFVTGARAAQQLIVCARLDGEQAVVVVAADAVEVAPLEPGLGFRAAAPGAVTLAGVTVPGDAVLARGEEAAAAISRASLAARIGGAALAVGSALASVEHARRHSEERIAFGKPLARQQAVGHKLVESRRRAEAARHLAWHAARLSDLGQDAGEVAELARLSATDAALHAADEAIQIHGGYGYTVEYHVERHYRDAKTLEVLDGGALALRDALAARIAAQAT